MVVEQGEYHGYNRDGYYDAAARARGGLEKRDVLTQGRPWVLRSCFMREGGLKQLQTIYDGPPVNCYVVEEGVGEFELDCTVTTRWARHPSPPRRLLEARRPPWPPPALAIGSWGGSGRSRDSLGAGDRGDRSRGRVRRPPMQQIWSLAFGEYGRIA